MKEQRPHRRTRRFIEILLIILIVLLFFSLFATFLTKLFVPGTSLKEMMRSDNAATGTNGDSPRSGAMLEAGGSDGSILDAFRSNALLSWAKNEVKSKRADSIAWGNAVPGMPLYNRDAIQTFKQSSAQISFDKKNSFSVGSNSLVIIKQVEKDLFKNARHSSMVVLEGELHGKLGGSGDNPLDLEIITPGGTARLKGKTRSHETTDFKISSNDDQSTSITVYKGEAEVSAGGRSVKVKANTSLTMKPGEKLGVPVALQAPPDLISPAEGSLFFFRDMPPAVPFSWEPVPGTDMFHMQIARDPSFKDIVFDKKFNRKEFMHENLKQGAYYWRVSSIREGGEGFYGKARRLELVQDSLPPRLLVNFPSGPVPESSFVLTGETEAGSRVFISGTEIQVTETGMFAQEMKIENRINLITVEAVDAAKNVSYRSQYIQGGF